MAIIDASQVFGAKEYADMEALSQINEEMKKLEAKKKVLSDKEWDTINSELIKLSNRVMTDSNQELYKNCRNRRNEFCKSLGINISDNFPDKPSQILDNFNAAFISKLATNADARKLQPKFKSNDNYIDEFLSLCDMTINNKTENLEERINGEKNES